MDADLSGACDGAETLWQYDAYGNLLDDGVETYTYDAALRLVSVSDGASTTTYAYNGDGDRVSQAVDSVTITYLHGLDLVAQSDGAATEYFASDGLGSVRQVADEAGAVDGHPDLRPVRKCICQCRQRHIKFRLYR